MRHRCDLEHLRKRDRCFLYLIADAIQGYLTAVVLAADALRIGSTQLDSVNSGCEGFALVACCVQRSVDGIVNSVSGFFYQYTSNHRFI